MNESYVWQVRYSGDTWLLEYDNERPDGHGFSEIDTRNIRCIDLLPMTEQGKVHSVVIPDGASPVFFRRRSIELNAEGEQGRSTVHCIGWKQGEQGVYLFVFDDASCLLSSDLQAV